MDMDEAPPPAAPARKMPRLQPQEDDEEVINPRVCANCNTPLLPDGWVSCRGCMKRYIHKRGCDVAAAAEAAEAKGMRSSRSCRVADMVEFCNVCVCGV